MISQSGVPHRVWQQQLQNPGTALGLVVALLWVEWQLHSTGVALGILLPPAQPGSHSGPAAGGSGTDPLVAEGDT